MDYVKASIVDHGSIARHTFSNANGNSDPCTPGQADPPKDTNAGKYDCFGEYSCS
jgi:hypothetical protein